MNKYSTKFKEEVVRKKLSGRPVLEISKETGVADVTIYQWAKRFQTGTLSTKESFPGNFSVNQKYQLLMDYYSIPKNKTGHWLRENGVHTEHITKWKNEIGVLMTKPSKEKDEIKKLKSELLTAHREIRKKDKALAEAAALLVLKKKYQYLWEEEEK